MSIGLVRRAALLAAYPLAKAGLIKADPHGGMLAAHLDNANKIGLGRYLRLKEFIHYNTDGPGNPYSSVWDRQADRAGVPLVPGHPDVQAVHARAAAAGARAARRERHGLAPVGAPVPGRQGRHPGDRGRLGRSRALGLVRVTAVERVDGALLFQPAPHVDERGFFSRTFDAEVARSAGLDPAAFTQDSQSRSVRGVVRGLHVRRGAGEAKLVRCSYGAVYDVIVDLRRARRPTSTGQASN